MRLTDKTVALLSRLGRALHGLLLGKEDEDLLPATRGQKVLRWFGIHLPQDRKDRLHIRPRFFRLIGLGLIGLFVLLLGLFEYSTSPRFCNSCHIMRPYYKAWHTSKHNFVRCVDCHYPPGHRDAIRVKFQALSQLAKYVTRTYGSKPYAEVEDASCLRPGCHATRLLEGKVVFKRGIIFDHKPHLSQPRRGRKLRCTSCHSQIVVGSHMTVTETTCFLCHFKGNVEGRTESPLAGCPSCHEYPSTPVKVGGITFRHDEFVGTRHVPCQNCHLDAIRGDGRAPKERCQGCHNEPDKLATVKDLPALHDNHVTVHNVECSRCHEEIQHSVRTTLTPLDYGCNVCHEKKHTAQKQMFMGTGGKDFPSVPSHMFVAQLDCIACHTEPEFSGEKATLAGQTFTASEKACVKCHGAKYQGILRSWKATFDVMLREIDPKLSSVTAASNRAGTGSDSGKRAAQLVTDARYNVEFVRLGRAVHNVFYAAGLLHVANRDLDDAMEALGQKPLLLPRQSHLGGDYCAVLCHDYAGVRMPERVSFAGKDVPHRKHFYQYGVACANCHSTESHKEVTLKPQDCASCHHGARNRKCEDCHRVQAGLYEGTFPAGGSEEKQPAPMYGTVECRGCHTEVNPGRTLQTVTAACNGCHEAGYGDMASEWLKELTGLANDASKRLESLRAALRRTGQEGSLSSADRDKLKRASEVVASLTPRRAVHNPALSEALLTKALEDMTELEARIGKAR